VAKGNQSFKHLDFQMPILLHPLDGILLNFIDDLNVLFIRKIRAFKYSSFFLPSYDSISDVNDYINQLYIRCSFFGGTLALNELHFR